MSGMYAVMQAVAEIQEAIEISSPYALATKKAHVSSPPPSEAISNFATFLNVFQPAESEVGVSMRVTKGSVRMQCILARAEPGDEKIQAAALAFWDATHDAFCQAVTLGGKASVALRIGGSDVPAFLERGGQLYIGFEMQLQVQLTEPYAWA